MTDVTEAPAGARPDVDLLDGTFYAGDPYPAFAWMRRHEPLYHDPHSGLWAVTRYEDVRAIGQDPGRFSNAGGSRPVGYAMPMMIDMDAPEHRRRRRLVSHGFTPAAVRDLEAHIRAICDDIIDQVCERGACDLVAEVAAPLPLYVIGDMLGIAPADRADLLRWSDTMLESQGSPDPGAAERATAAFGEWQAYIAARIEERRRSGRADDLIGTLVHAEVDGDRLDDESLVFESLLILVGGDETTRHVISGGIEALLRHPEQAEALRADRSLVPGAVEEMLRWVSPIKNMTRTATEAVTLHGCTVEAGQQLLLMYPSANRDETVFDRPDTFDVRRTPNDHVAFGFGAHLCLGNRLARAELAVMVDRLLDRLPDLRLADPDTPLERRPSNFISGLESLPVVFTPTARG